MRIPLESLIVTSVRFTGMAPAFVAMMTPVFPMGEQDAARIICSSRIGGGEVVVLAACGLAVPTRYPTTPLARIKKTIKRVMAALLIPFDDWLGWIYAYS
jgi:hypothetical protein